MATVALGQGNPTRPSAAKPFEGADNKVQGVMLVEVLDGRKLKVEIFPGRMAGDVKSFTEAALTYER